MTSSAQREVTLIKSQKVDEYAENSLCTHFIVKMLGKTYGRSKAIPLQAKVCEYPCLKE